MIERLVLNKRSKYELIDLLNFLELHPVPDMYYTINDTRIYVIDYHTLRNFIKQTVVCYVSKENGDYKGIIMVIKSHGDKKKHYVKINAQSVEVAKDLLTVVLWNFNKELFCKIKEKNPFMEAFKFKGFKFLYVSGNQSILRREKNAFEYKNLEKPGDGD